MAEVCTGRKSKVQRENPEASSIHMLPDELLVIILSCLSIKEAARASVLSRRWRYLWRFRSSDIVLELEHENAENDSPLELSESLNLVNQVLALHQGPSVDKLVIRFSPLAHVSPDIVPLSDWIRFAMQKKVQVLELPFFCSNFLSIDKFLSISRAVEPENSFASLNSFTLVDFHIKDEMIEYLLSICLNLEHLSLKGGKLPNNLSIISPSLKSFSICNCSFLRMLTISAANLVSFAHTGHSRLVLLTFLSFQNVPLLSELTMDRTYIWSFMYGRIHKIYQKQLVKLVLIFSNEVITQMSCHTSYRTIPCLRRVKHLELVITVIPGASLLFYVFWVMACPSLSTLYVQWLVFLPCLCLPVAFMVGWVWYSKSAFVNF